MLKIKYTKFFDVDNLLANSNNTEKTNNVGVDLLMPNPSQEFFEAIVKSNEQFNFTRFEINYFETTGKIKSCIIGTESRVLLQYNDNKYSLFENLQIPSGIGILIPKGYHVDLRGKSSNFKNLYTVILGTVDLDYTYGMGIQIVKLSDKCLEFLPGQKMAQILFIKSKCVNVMEYIPLDIFEALKEVINKRLKRFGGFGSTGLFNKNKK